MDATTTPSGSPPPSVPAARRRAADLALVALIIAVVFACYWPARRAPFVFDDYPAILRNPSIRHLAAWRDVLDPPMTAAGAAGRPVVNLSLAVDYALHGESPAGFRVTNLLLHAFTAGLLFAVVRRVLQLRGAPSSGRPADATPGALAVALVWAVHPLLTETVACVIQRNEILVAASVLGTLYALLRAHASQRPRGWLAAGVITAWLGAASKEVAAVTPLLVLLFDGVFLGRSRERIWRERRLFYAGLAATWLLIGWLALRGADRAGTVGFGLGVSPFAYAFTQCRAVVLYVQLTLWPHPLVVDYGMPLFTPAAVWPELAALAIAALLVTVAAARRSAAGFLGAAFFLLLAPSSSVVPLTTQTIAEHRMYLPGAALVIAAGLAVVRLIGARWALAAAAGVLALAGTTVRRTADYRTEITLWRDTVAKAPDNARAHASLAGAYLRADRVADAIAAYRRALALRPDYADAHNDLGLALGRAGRPAEAAREFETAARLKPADPEIRYNLADAYATLDRNTAATRQYERALELRPGFAAAENNLGRLLLADGNVAAALVRLGAAVQLEPENAAARRNLALALTRAGRNADAIRQFRSLVALQPQSADAHNELGLALRDHGEAAAALREFQFATELKPDFAAAHINAGMLQAAAGDPAAAAEHYRAAARLLPANAELHYNYASVLAQLGRRAEAVTELQTALRLEPDFTAAAQALRSLQPAP